jgi:membrane protease YdiL (CAAX protease family)
VLSLVYAGGDRPGGQLATLALNGVALAIAAVTAVLLMVRFVDHRPLKTFGVGFLPHWRRHLAAGLGLAAGMLAVLMAGCFAFGYVHMGWTGRQVPVLTLAATLGVLLLAAANEEMIFRGFPLQVLIEGFGKWPAVLFLSVLFGMLHLSNPNSSFLGIANTILAGILLSLAYVRTRSLWFPYGIHAGWNVGLGFILGFPLSGVDLASVWTTGIAGRDTILGGEYGPEGGLLATFIFASSAVMVQSWGRESPTIRSKSK